MAPRVDGQGDPQRAGRPSSGTQGVASHRGERAPSGFAVVEEMWEPTIERARGLPISKIHERVNGEYSFVQTLRHLLFAWDVWITRMVLRIPNGYHPWGVPPEGADPPEGGGADVEVELDSVLQVRAGKFARVGTYLSSASDAALQTVVSPPDHSGWPPTNFPVIYCFRVVLHEEWWHHQFALRDLAVLETRSGQPANSADWRSVLPTRDSPPGSSAQWPLRSTVRPPESRSCSLRSPPSWASASSPGRPLPPPPNLPTSLRCHSAGNVLEDPCSGDRPAKWPLDPVRTGRARRDTEFSWTVIDRERNSPRRG